MLQVRLTGPGGHTSRPHNTVDLVHVLSTVATGLPDALGRLVDPRAGLCLVWGHVSAGVAHNAIPRTGVLKGTLRVLDKNAWHGAPAMVQRIVDGLVAPYGAHAEVTYERGVPPVVNDPSATALMAAAVRSALGTGSAVPTAAVARRRGLRLVPRPRARLDGPPRRQAARPGAAARPAPGRVRRRRGGAAGGGARSLRRDGAGARCRAA